MTNKIIFIIILNLSACSYFSKKIESLVVNEKNISLGINKVVDKKLFCPEKNNIQLILEDELSLKYYSNFQDKIFGNEKLSFIQKAVALSLIEMNRRPDISSPRARLQYYLRYQNKDYYLDFSAIDINNPNSMPYIKGLDYLIKTFEATKSLKKIAELLDKEVPINTNVAPRLEDFLKKNKKEILVDEKLSQYFVKGDEVLTKYESFKRDSFTKTINQFQTNQYISNSLYNNATNLLSENSDIYGKKFNIKCNYDLSKKFNINKSLIDIEKNNSLYFAIKEKENFFIAVTTSIPKIPLESFNKSSFILNSPTQSAVPICEFSNLSQKIVLFSTNDKSPIQHLKHLLDYDITSSTSFDDLSNILNFSRHIFLSNPDRVLYESKRGRKAQLDFFLSMNFPIYHSDKLGEIFGFAEFAHLGGKLLIDDRSTAKLWCSP